MPIDEAVKTAPARRFASAKDIEEFVSVLRDELTRRLEANVNDGCCRALLERVERGEVDPDGIEADQQRHGDKRDPDEVGGQHLHRGAQRGDAL